MLTNDWLGTDIVNTLEGGGQGFLVNGD